MLVSHVVVPLIDHETATLHPAGVAPAKVRRHIGAVARALIGAALEVFVLVENDLKEDGY